MKSFVKNRKKTDKASGSKKTEPSEFPAREIDEDMTKEDHLKKTAAHEQAVHDPAAHEKNHHEKKHESKIDETVKKTETAAEDLAAEFAEKMKEADHKTEDKMVKIKESELESLKKECNDAKDRGLRALAELENYRNRARRDMEDRTKYASMDLARAVLPVWDNMGRALEAAEKDLHPEAILDGLKMMSKQFVDVLKNHHIVKIDALHKPFDPNFHESIAQIPNAEFPAGTVIVEVQPGFMLHDRVVRPAQVVLAAPMPKQAAPAENNKND